MDGSAQGSPPVSDRIWTPPNVLSMLRLLVVPVFDDAPVPVDVLLLPPVALLSLIHI